MIASVYASSPEAHPADHTRIGSPSRLAVRMRGITSLCTCSHAGGSRKKVVTLMRMVLKSGTNSSGCTSRWSA
jgi:hypothetical protein